MCRKFDDEFMKMLQTGQEIRTVLAGMRKQMQDSFEKMDDEIKDLMDLINERRGTVAPAKPDSKSKKSKYSDLDDILKDVESPEYHDDTDRGHKFFGE